MNSSRSNLAIPNRDFLILENQVNARKLARSILRRWNTTISWESLNSVVDYSLCRAADNFSPSRGTSFISYLYHYLRGDLAKEVERRVRQARIKAVAGQMTRPDIAPVSGSTAASLSDDELAAGFDAFAPPRTETPEDYLLARETAAVVQTECSGLDLRQRQVLQCIYVEERNVKDVAHQLGCSQRLVFMLKKKALHSLRSIFTGIAGTKETRSGTQVCVESRRCPAEVGDIRPYFYSRRNLPIPKKK